MDTKEKLQKGNEKYLKTLQNDENLRFLRDNLVKGQHPEILVITCSDSRVIPEKIFSADLGELFVIRTAGNVINEGELATIEYAIEHLKVNHIVVLGHTHCGAVHAAIYNESGRYLDPIIKRIQKNIIDAKDEVKASSLNAQKEVQFIKEKFPEYQGTIETKLFDIETSKVTNI